VVIIKIFEGCNSILFRISIAALMQVKISY